MPSYLLHLFWYLSVLFWHVSYAPPLPHALTNPVKEGEVTGDGEEGGGEDHLGLKELGLIVLDAAGRQNGFVATSSCTLQPWQTVVVPLMSQARVQTLRFLWLELLLNEAIKCNNFYPGFAHLKTKLDFLKSALALQAPEDKKSIPFSLRF